MTLSSQDRKDDKSVLYKNSVCAFYPEILMQTLIFVMSVHFLTQYCAGDNIEKNEMCVACSAGGGGERRV
jgi:hypothetical protein